jgi:hypothetical protein
MIKNIQDIQKLKPTEIRKLSKAELEEIVPLLRAEYKRYESFASVIKNDSERREAVNTEWRLRDLYDAGRNRLEKYAKEERKALREAKQNSKQIERKRIEDLASTLRKNLVPVENALVKSIIERDNFRLEKQDEFFKSLPTPYVFNFTSRYSQEKDEIEYIEFNHQYGRFWSYERLENDYRPHAPKKAYQKDNLSERIEKDAKDYAKTACDEFAFKIVQKTEEEIKSRGTDDKIVSTSYEGNVNPWDGGQVIVTTTKGKYVWNTKVILNFSKYGLPFNQWPTRLA